MQKFAAVTLIGFLSATASHAQVFEGPYYGNVTRIIDGDNFEATIDIWPTVSATVSVRIIGIDAPELFRPKCEKEEMAAVKAKAALEELLPENTVIRLEDVEADSFSGRVLAIALRQGEVRGRNLTELLLNREVVKPWTPDQPDIDWCGENG